MRVYDTVVNETLELLVELRDEGTLDPTIMSTRIRDIAEELAASVCEELDEPIPDQTVLGLGWVDMPV